LPALRLAVTQHLKSELQLRVGPLPPKSPWHRCIDALLAHDSRDYLHKIVAPTLICSATDDLLVPVNHARQLDDAIAHAQLKLFGQGGHHFPQTDPDGFNEALSGFLRDTTGPQRRLYHE
jgi:pimeloyl-ACP methyl ester carboxylesterase